jgi:hypothetical protein
MLELLLAAATEAVAPTPLQLYGPLGAVVVLLGGPKGVAWLLGILQSRKGSGNGGKTCPVHAEFAARLDERHAVITAALERIEAGQVRTHERIDELQHALTAQVPDRQSR